MLHGVIAVTTVAAVIFIFVDACQVTPIPTQTTTTDPNNNSSGRRKRAINGEDDVIRDKITVIVYTKRAYDDSALESNMKIVKDAVWKFAVSYIVESKPCRDVKTFVTNSKGVSTEVSYFFINCVYSSFII
ncbi:hypothetical protein WR25_06470 [Diploscapter pachys]|uniref:Uncharacterized protein n=1 Tax=Diploscapter pachys TaxID=2018661 RepID=A0A2A2LFA9_9BILA|nr:hypothetical protein WR25_06470 [Diploscapter pachys]